MGVTIIANGSGNISKPGLSPAQLPKHSRCNQRHTLSSRKRILLTICRYIHYNIIIRCCPELRRLCHTKIAEQKGHSMTKKKCSRVSTLTGFLRWTTQFTDGQYLFRGVQEDTFEIEASACYRMDEKDKTVLNLITVNEDLINRARLLGHYQQIGQQLFDLDLLAELQHFGAATCLIDFSRSAQIALWFACQQNSNKPKRGKVFAIRIDDISRFEQVKAEMVEKKKIRDFFRPGDKTSEYPMYTWQPKYQNNRIIAQQSVFVFGGAKVEEAAHCIVYKECKKDILASLATVSGMTEDSIFPDADNFARQNAWDKLSFAPKTSDTRQHGSIALEKEQQLADTASLPKPQLTKIATLEIAENVRQPGKK